jgi:circadian clock protein KaiB
MYEFRIYIVGGYNGSANVLKHISSLDKLLEEKLGNEYSLTIIDILENHKLAKEDGIFCTPTIVRIFPPPVKKVVGDFSDGENLLDLLYVFSSTGS